MTVTSFRLSQLTSRLSRRRPRGSRANAARRALRSGSAAVILVASLLVAAPAAGQGAGEGFDFYRRGPYRQDVPTPRDHLGYDLGTLHTPHERMVGYFEALADAAPKRIELETYGRSYEGQRLLLAFVGSEESVGSRERIRRAVGRLADPGRTSPTAADSLARVTPVVVWLDYANDGNETANLEAAMQVAYQLVAGEGRRARRLREEALVVINPDHNPESHDRHVSWYNAFGIGAADPAAMEHHAPWGMSTNNNHYQIDLNRDGWGLTQRENQALAAEVLAWRPQVFVDHHGQTEQYFFPPPVRPVNPFLPESHLRWYEAFGRGNAAVFDRHGWQYYVRDVFDLHYPGYWDSWPALHGAIGMTYETDGGGSRGLRWRRRDGTVVTFRDGIAHHFVASLATVETAVENREALLRDFAAFFRGAVERGREERPARGWALLPDGDPRRAASLVATLLRHGVRVGRAAETFEARARHHQSGETVVRRFPAGTYVVDAAQPEGRAAANFLAADVPLDSTFVREQLARWSRNARRGEDAPKERYEFYDITAWSLPLVYGVDAYALADLPQLRREPVRPTASLAGSGGWRDEIPFDPPDVEGGVEEVIGSAGERGTQARSAYLFRPGTEGALRLLAGLLREGYEVAVSTRPLAVEERDFPRGTFVLRTSRNPASIHERIERLAREAGVPVVASHTAFPAFGQTGPGSGSVRGLHRPRLAVVADEGVRTTSYGHTWFTLERRLGYPFTPIRFEQLVPEIDAFDVVVLPDGSPGAYREALGERGLERLSGWLERGGTLVGWGGAAVLAVEEGLVSASLVAREAAGEGAIDTVTARERLDVIDRLPQAREPRPPAVSPTASPGALQPVPGAILRAELDLTHWLTSGYGDATLPVPAMGDDFLTLSKIGSSPVVFPEEGDFHISGFVWPGNTLRLLAGTAHAVVEPTGRGQVVLLNSDPNYRLVWRATARLFANALLLGPTLGADRPGRY